MPDGGRFIYVDNGNRTLLRPRAATTRLSNGDGSFNLTLQRSKTVYHYLATGAIASMTDDYGNALFHIRRERQTAASLRRLRIWPVPQRVLGRQRPDQQHQDSAGRQVQYGYGSQGNLATVTDPLNHVTTYGTVAGKFVPLLSSITDNWGRAITNVTYDAADRVKTYSENGETYTYTYSYQGNPNQTAKADSSGNLWVYPFGSGPGLVSDDIPPAGSGVGTAHTDFNADGTPQQRIDQLGVKTYYTYDGTGRVLTVTKDYQGSTAVRFDYTYDPAFPEKVASITPKNPSTGLVNYDWQGWQYVYWQAGRPGAKVTSLRQPCQERRHDGDQSPRTRMTLTAGSSNN